MKTCPSCSFDQIPEESTTCPDCGFSLRSDFTIFPSPKESDRSRDARRLNRPRDTAEPPRKPPAPPSPKPEAPITSTTPAKPATSPTLKVERPSPPPPAEEVPSRPDASPGWIRGIFSKKPAGKGEIEAPAGPPAAREPATSPRTPTAPSTPKVSAPMPEPPNPRTSGSRPRQEPPPPQRPEPSFDDVFTEQDSDRTIAQVGVDLSRLKIPEATYAIEIFDKTGQWRNWGPIPLQGLSVGRTRSGADFPALNSMAVKHMKFKYDNTGLTVEDLGTLNGVALRLTEPVALADGQRFRIGDHVLEFRDADPFPTSSTLHSDDGEEFCSRDLPALAYIDLIRQDNRPSLRFPITKPGVTVIGRGGDRVSIALTGDALASGRHAQVRYSEGTFYLEDLNSRNGTFVHIRGTAPVTSGTILLAGQVLFRVVDRG